MEPYLQKRFAKKHQHKYFVDSETSDSVCLCGKVRGSPKATKNKYNATTCFYDGNWYDSKFEAQYARDLDFRVKSKDIISWERQYPVRIVYRGDKICTLWVDFRIHHNDDSYELAETKGYATDVYKLKRKLLEIMWLPDHPDTTYTVIT